jgi:hypothetical protein
MYAPDRGIRREQSVVAPGHRLLASRLIVEHGADTPDDFPAGALLDGV